MSKENRYNSNLQAGLGLVRETRELLELWVSGMSASQLRQAALESGRFPWMTARRLRNMVIECFAPRYLVQGGAPAAHLQRLAPVLPAAELAQLMLLFTCRANPILADFIRQVYWPRYAGGYQQIDTHDARAFVERSMENGKMATRWSEATIRRVSGYLTGCCADYGMLERGARSSRRILSFRLAGAVAAYLAHDLHFAGIPDNALLSHPDWELFGMSRPEVLEEMKRLGLKSLFIVQAAGEVVRISWKLQTMEALCDVIAEGGL